MFDMVTAFFTSVIFKYIAIITVVFKYTNMIPRKRIFSNVIVDDAEGGCTSSKRTFKFQTFKLESIVDRSHDRWNMDKVHRRLTGELYIFCSLSQ